MIKNGQSQLVNEKQKMMNDIKGEIVELVTLATARVARMDTDDAHIQNHIKQAIETLK
jgi:flagellar biosynthesis/type III secretory pathway protein FliH